MKRRSFIAGMLASPFARVAAPLSVPAARVADKAVSRFGIMGHIDVGKTSVSPAVMRYMQNNTTNLVRRLK